MGQSYTSDPFLSLIWAGTISEIFLLAVYRPPPNPLFYLETYMNIYGTQRGGFFWFAKFNR